VQADEDRKKNRYHFDRHTPEYRGQFETITAEMLSKCPIAWSDTYDGHFVAAGHEQVFELARSAEYLSNDHDVNNERRGYQGITIPSPKESEFQGGFLEMDPPEQRHYRQALNAYLSPPPPCSAGSRSPTSWSALPWTRRSRPAGSTSSMTSPTSCRRS
jgi:cytochrome P450